MKKPKTKPFNIGFFSFWLHFFVVTIEIRFGAPVSADMVMSSMTQTSATISNWMVLICLFLSSQIFFSYHWCEHASLHSCTNVWIFPCDAISFSVPIFLYYFHGFPYLPFWASFCYHLYPLFSRNSFWRLYVQFRVTHREFPSWADSPVTLFEFISSEKGRLCRLGASLWMSSYRGGTEMEEGEWRFKTAWEWCFS